MGSEHNSRKSRSKGDTVSLPLNQPPDAQKLMRQLEAYRIELKAQTTALSEALTEIESLRASGNLSEEDLVGCLTLDRSGTILKVNRAAAGMLGGDSSLLAGQSFYVLVREEYRSTFSLFLQHCGRSNDAVVEQELRLDVAFPCYVRLIAKSHGRAEEAAGRFETLVFNITNRRLAEEAFLENEKRLQDIIDGAPSLFFVKDLEGRFLLTNRRVNEVLGSSAEAIRGKTDYDFFPKEQAEYYRAHDRKVLESGEAELLEEVTDTAEGKRVVFLANKFPLFKPDGTPFAICSISHDITELVQSRKDLQEAASSYQALVSESTESLALVALDGTIRCASNAACEALGLEKGELDGRHAQTLLPEGLDLSTRLFLQNFLVNPQVPVRTPVKLRHKLHGAQWFDLRIKTISLGEGKAYLIHLDRPLV